MSRSKEMAEKLNELLEKNYDTEKVFKKASQEIDHEGLKAFFQEKAAERYNFGHQLKSEIRSFGESPEGESSIEGEGHLAWINIKTAFSSGKEEAVIKEIVRAEKLAIEDYNKIIREDGFPPSTANLLLRQRKIIESSLEEVTSLEREFDT